MNRLYQELQAVYENTNRTHAEIIALKKETISNFQADVKVHYATYFKTGDYAFISSFPVNNAYLMSFNNYEKRQDDFELFYRMCNSNLVRMIRELKEMPRTDKPLEWLHSRTGNL